MNTDTPTILTVPSQNFELSKPTAAAHKKLAKRIAEHNAEAEQWHTDRATVYNAEATDLDAVELAERLPMRRLKLIAQEVKLREDLEAWFKQRRADRREATKAASEELAAAETGLVAALVELGYVEAEPFANVVGKIKPGMILDHPRTHALRERVKELNAAGDPQREANKAALAVAKRAAENARAKVAS